MGNRDCMEGIVAAALEVGPLGAASSIQQQAASPRSDESRHKAHCEDKVESELSAPQSETTSRVASCIESVRPAEEVKNPVAAQESAIPKATSSSSTSKAEEVDLSFATFEAKPIKFIKRTMGEARKLLSAKGLEEARNLKYEFTLLDRDSLSKWKVRLSDLNPDGTLAKQLQERGIDKSIDLEISLPNEYPLEPPFVRVVYPYLSGGFIFTHGGICFELLTKKGWAPSFTLPSVAMAVQGIMDLGGVSVKAGGNPQTRTVPEFTEAGARQDARHINSAHNNGEGRTYGSAKLNS